MNVRDMIHDDPEEERFEKRPRFIMDLYLFMRTAAVIEINEAEYDEESR